MDNRTLTSLLAQRMQTDTKTAARHMASLVDVLAQRLADLDTVAIPGFGNFEPVKRNEHLEHDAEYGRSMLVPPSITVNFKPAARLRKSALS